MIGMSDVSSPTGGRLSSVSPCAAAGGSGAACASARDPAPRRPAPARARARLGVGDRRFLDGVGDVCRRRLLVLRLGLLRRGRQRRRLVDHGRGAHRRLGSRRDGGAPEAQRSERGAALGGALGLDRLHRAVERGEAPGGFRAHGVVRACKALGGENLRAATVGDADLRKRSVAAHANDLVRVSTIGHRHPSVEDEKACAASSEGVPPWPLSCER